jgi:hypothetical protein
VPFYIMQQDTMVDGPRALDGVPDHMDSLEWQQGQAMPDPSAGKVLTLELSLESGEFRGSIIEGFLTLYHKSLKKALTEQGVDNIDYFPVQLHDQNTEKMDGSYFLANILGLIDCVDMGKSKVKMWKSGNGFRFESMVIDESKTRGLKIFRLKDDPTKVIINEQLKQYFDSVDVLSGVEIIQTEDYSQF